MNETADTAQDQPPRIDGHTSRRSPSGRWITACHNVDENGNPAGGYTKGCGLRIEWQDGPLRKDGVERDPNGAFVEQALLAAIDRLEFYQKSRFACRENDIAIMHLEQALFWCEYRTAGRQARGVEGTHQT